MGRTHDGHQSFSHAIVFLVAGRRLNDIVRTMSVCEISSLEGFDLEKKSSRR